MNSVIKEMRSHQFGDLIQPSLVLKRQEPCCPSETNKTPGIMHELSNVITEWGVIMKELYVSHYSIETIEKYMNELLKYRKEILNGTFLKNQLKEKQKLAALTIDVGNKLLGLDMIVRTEEGYLFNPLSISTLRLYESYVTTTARIKTDNAVEDYKKSIREYDSQCGYTINLSVKFKLQKSIIRNIDVVKQITFSKDLTLKQVKSDFKKMRKTFQKGHDVLSFLNRTSHFEALFESLSALKKLNVEELFMFLHDILDAIFNIYKLSPNSDIFDKTVFDCLIYIFELVSDEHHQQFKPILDLYINKYFNSDIAYIKLAEILKYNLSPLYQIEEFIPLNVIKSFKYIMKCIVRSRLLSSKKVQDNDQCVFENSISDILNFVINAMSNNTIKINNAFLFSALLQYVPQSFPDIMTVFNAIQLSSLLVKFVDNLPSKNEFIHQNLIVINNIVHSQLFSYADSRAILISCVLQKIEKIYLFVVNCSDPDMASLSMCIRLFDDIMLYMVNTTTALNGITKMSTTLRTVMQLLAAKDRTEHSAGSAAALLISMLRHMTAEQFNELAKCIETKTLLLDFSKGLLLVFTELVSRPAFPGDWCDMIMLQNSVVLKTLEYLSHTIRESFFDDFDREVWMAFFHCAFTFLMQPSLQLEKFSPTKRLRIVSVHKDMRVEYESLVRTMWFHLGKHKLRVMPDLVGSTLEMSLIPHGEIRKATIPMLFDMMQCEFHSCKEGIVNIEDSNGVNGNFDVFQNMTIKNLDRLVLTGKGDEQYKEMFNTIMSSLCEKDTSMRERGNQFVETITVLLDYLLGYKISLHYNNKDYIKFNTANLLNFYNDCQHKELIVSYVHKLCSVHLEREDFTEAANTLKLHSDLLSWSYDPLPLILKFPLRYPTCETHCQLKEALLNDIIIYSNYGKMWECAISACKELVIQCESLTYNYMKMKLLLQRMSIFYENLMKKRRTEPIYYQIAVYGKGYRSYLQNKIFIYRGKEGERRSDVIKNLLHAFPNSVVKENLIKPGPEITDSPKQVINLNIVKPVMDHFDENLTDCDQILQYYKLNYVQKFKYSKRYRKIDSKINVDNENDVANLWTECTVFKTAYLFPGIMRLHLVTDSDTYEISPLKNAIEIMEEKNRELNKLLIIHHNDPELSLEPLLRNLIGIVDAPVMGGVLKYEQAFFTPEYLLNHKEDKQLIECLKNRIASLIPLLDIGIKLHGHRESLSSYEMQSHLEKCFEKLKRHIEENYGKKTCYIVFDIKRNVENTFDNKIPSNAMIGSNIVWCFITMEHYIATKCANGFSGFISNSELRFESTLTGKRKKNTMKTKYSTLQSSR